jgi:hypothetical protein
MSGGYTPVFQSIFDGTLHGRWPQTGVWLALLAMADKHGGIDRTPQAIASDIGISADELMMCITEFCQPDLMSRTPDEEGRRLVLLEPSRAWGWRIVNHGRYREKARLAAKSAREVESGGNAERLKERVTAADRRSPPETAADPLSNANANTCKTVARKRATRCPEPFPITEDMRAWALAKCPHVKNVDGATEEFVDYWRGVSGRSGVKLDWEGTWRNRFRELEERSGRRNGQEKAVSEWR